MKFSSYILVSTCTVTLPVTGISVSTRTLQSLPFIGRLIVFGNPFSATIELDIVAILFGKINFEQKSKFH